MKRILVPCDFSSTAQQAYSFALSIARKTDASVSVLKAIDFPFMYETTYGAGPFYYDPGLWSVLEGDAKQSFEQMKAAHDQYGEVSFSVARGPVTQTIRTFIDSNNIDLVVMGTNGATGLSGYFIGSNTEKVVRYSKVPVFAIRKAVDLSSIRNIIVPTNLSLHQSGFMSRLKELQSFFHATLHLLYIDTPANFKRTTDEAAEMKEFASHYHLKDYTCSLRNDVREADGIMNFAGEIKADLIAMATHGRRGLAHLFTGSVTEDVVNQADLPIWTFTLNN